MIVVYIAAGVGFVVLLMALRIMLVSIEAPPEAASPISTDGKAVRLEGTRYLEYRAGIHIDAEPAAVWALLTDAKRYPEWNSTIERIDGDIAPGGKLKLVAKIAPDRVFPLTVSAHEPPRKLVWQDGNRVFKGVRTFTLTATSGGTDVTMAEVLTGAFLPQIAPKLPDFRPPFEAFLSDLKRAAEA